MSYGYRITVTRTVSETVKGKDRSTNRVQLTEILPPERMKEMLGRALEKKGFKKQADGTWIRTSSGVTETFNPETMEVTAQAEAKGDIKKQKSVQAAGDARDLRDAGHQRAHVEAEVGARLEKEIAVSEAERKAKQSELEAEARKQLEETEAKRGKDLHEATLDVYAEALKEKARTLGEVKEMHESKRSDGAGGQDYELTIKVEES